MREFLRELWRRDPVLTGVAAVFALLAAGCLLAMPFDDRTILGLDPWVKPMKFLLSIGIYLGTLGWILADLGRPRWVVGLVRWGALIPMLIEAGLIVMQSVRGTRSHFNFDSAFDGSVFAAMGLLIAWNTLMVTVLAVAFLLRRPDLPPAYLWGIRLGLVIFVLGSLQGVFIVQNNAHTIGAPDGGPGLPFVNWSTRAGDLRVAHALGLHALQALPLLGALLHRRGRLPAGGAAAAVWLAAALWTGLAIALFVQAVRGIPLLPG